MPVSVDASKTLIAGVSSLTWANRPSSANASGLYLFTDIGSSGTLMRYAGSRWRPLAGQAQLAQLGAAVTGITNSETIVLQTLIPAGALQTNDSIRVYFTGAKSGATDTGSITVRVGTAGTTADTAITGLSARGAWGTTSRTAGYVFDVKLLSADSVQALGAAGTNAIGYLGAATSILPAATTITNSSVNALYVSVSFTSGGAADTLSIQSAQIQLLTP